MNVFLNTDPHIDGGHPMTRHVETVVTEALSRFGERVTRVDAHLVDLGGSAKGGGDTIRCTLQASLVGLEPIVAKDDADNAHQAIQGAVGKLKRAVESALGKHEPRR